MNTSSAAHMNGMPLDQCRAHISLLLCVAVTAGLWGNHAEVEELQMGGPVHLEVCQVSENGEGLAARVRRRVAGSQQALQRGQAARVEEGTPEAVIAKQTAQRVQALRGRLFVVQPHQLQQKENAVRYNVLSSKHSAMIGIVIMNV